MTTERFDPFITEWLSFSQNPKYNLIEKCLKLAQILDYPELNITDYIEKINQIGNSLKLKIDDVENPIYLISMLSVMGIPDFLSITVFRKLFRGS